MVYRLFKPVLQALIQITILLFGIVWVLESGAQAMGYQWQWDRIPDYIAFYEDGQWWPAELLDGVMVTIRLSALSLCFTLVIGFITALLRLSHSIIGRAIGSAYVELIRNTPLLVQVYLLYFVFGPMLSLDRFSTAVLALSLFQGAYTAEILRAGLNSISKGQFEAAKTLGLSSFHTYKTVIMPQVLQRTLPALTNEVVSLVKNSSIVSVMAIFDLTTQARNIVSETAMPFEVWFTVAAIYLVLTLTLSAISALLEHKLGASWRKP
ncbi:amino acid ABC transporter permease [Vibrio sagamiensis]|uniref:Putative glutamine transport system permease protein GlnP n=1 Tax=Vibrio sagamiensis NBRC 104589 TaxID=1219064 RepID=A0A511QFQ0_9VIBR|nr:amino acid ABC transporter permease [Vibrio sagamiensis]PNQ64501.1 amino acid ABC transporter permease [Vibrio agarivorans]GEM76129.1 polar amino acid ABC transporter permease [Vibrio sagamiensis NBRC 104589]